METRYRVTIEINRAHVDDEDGIQQLDFLSDEEVGMYDTLEEAEAAAEKAFNASS